MPDGTIDPAVDPVVDYVARFSQDIDITWPAITTARRSALEVQELLFRTLRQFTSDDVDIVLFVSGLLMVFSCYKNESLQRNGDNPDSYLLWLQKHLLNFVQSTPLNIFVWTLRELHLDQECQEFLNHYEQFLQKINDPEVRKNLGELREEEVYEDQTFLECRKISHDLQTTLKKLCFETESPLREFTYEYGVF